MSSILLLPLAIYTSFVFGINNSGLSTGSLLASGFSYKKAAVLTGAGFAAGILLEGWKMGSSIDSLAGSMTVTPLLLALMVTAVIFSIFAFLGLPISLVNVLVGSLVGVSVAMSLSMNYAYLNVLVLSWITLPFIAAVATIGAYKITVRALRNISPIGMGKFHFVTVPILVFYTAYSLGANNIGLLYHLSANESHLLLLALLPLASFLGVMRGRRTSMFVSEGVVGHSPLTIFSSLLVSAVLVWIFTQGAIPVSLSQILLGSLLGVNLYRRPREYNRRALTKLIVSWVGVTVASFVIALWIGFLIQV